MFEGIKVGDKVFIKKTYNFGFKGHSFWEEEEVSSITLKRFSIGSRVFRKDTGREVGRYSGGFEKPTRNLPEGVTLKDEKRRYIRTKNSYIISRFLPFSNIKDKLLEDDDFYYRALTLYKDLKDFQKEYDLAEV